MDILSNVENIKILKDMFFTILSYNNLGRKHVVDIIGLDVLTKIFHFLLYSSVQILRCKNKEHKIHDDGKPTNKIT